MTDTLIEQIKTTPALSRLLIHWAEDTGYGADEPQRHQQLQGQPLAEMGLIVFEDKYDNGNVRVRVTPEGLKIADEISLPNGRPAVGSWVEAPGEKSWKSAHRRKPTDVRHQMFGTVLDPNDWDRLPYGLQHKNTIPVEVDWTHITTVSRAFGMKTDRTPYRWEGVKWIPYRFARPVNDAQAERLTKDREAFRARYETLGERRSRQRKAKRDQRAREDAQARRREELRAARG